MGLDNGMTIKSKTIKGSNYLLKDSPFRNNTEYPVEICYFRKCYNIRNKFFEIFSTAKDNDDSSPSLSLVDLNVFAEKVLKFFLDENNWATNSGSIWEWHEMLPSLAEAIHDIRNFLEDCERYELTDSDFEINFYDSY